MRFLSIIPAPRAVLWLGTLALLVFSLSPAAQASNIGTVVPVLGVVADLTYDSARNLVYLANFSRNEVDIYSVDQKKLVGSVPVGLQPASLALSPDLNTLYVANIGSNTISTINLNNSQRGNDYTAQSPLAIAVGGDGQVLILSTTTLQRLDPVSGRISAVPIAPPPTTLPGLPTIAPSPTPTAFLPGMVSSASGNIIIGLTSNRLFVYEVSSGVVLRSRNVSGMRSIMSASTDGSRFMAGPFLFDTQTLTILGRAGTLPAGVAAAFTGGSAFSVDGNSVYATFSTQPPINPLNPNNPQNPSTTPTITPTTPSTQLTSVLQVLRSSSLTPQLGLRLPESLTTKIIASSDGQNLFASSTSGMTVIPIGQLTSVPILDVSSTNVVLSRDTCNRTIATATIQVRNLGGGRMTFSAGANGPIVLSQRTGIAPATLTITFDPRTTTGLVRGTQQYVVSLSSPEAVNVEPAILVSFNFRDVSDRGAIVPINGVAVDMQMDSARQRLYIANYTQDQIEVFSLVTQSFLSPIRVGNRPLSMAMANPSTLVVANSGSENLSVVDLDALQEVDEIPMGPVPITTATLFPRYIAASSNAILFTAVPLPNTLGTLPGNGSAVWQLSLLSRSAFPRLDLGTGTVNSIGAHNVLTAAGDGSGILIADAAANNTANLRFYDPISDTFPVNRLAAAAQGVANFRGGVAAAPDGSFFVVDNLVFNSVLSSQGSVGASTVGVNAGQVQAVANAFGAVIGNNALVRVQTLPQPTNNVAGTLPQNPVQALQRFSLSPLQQNLQVNLPEQVMDITPNQIGVANAIPQRQWPPRPVALELGVTGQTQILPHGIALDGANNVYLLSWSGLSIVSTTAAGGRGPSFTASGVVNTASRKAQFAPGSLISILGNNLADFANSTGDPLPRTLGGVCVTANEVTLPLISTSPNEIDAQLPTEFGTGRVTLTVRSTTLGQSSGGVQIALNPTGPGVFSVDAGVGLKVAAIIHGGDFALVTPDYPADRDETIILYTTGLGHVDPNVATGLQASPDPFSGTTEPVEVSIGGLPYPVLWSGLSPYMVGIYQINLYVPGNRIRGDNLPVVVTAGGISSATDDAPVTAVH